MDIGRTFSYVTEDESWISKILIGGLISLIPIVGQLVLLGWVVQIARNVAAGVPKPIPGWSDFGEKLSIGFGAFVVQLVYYIPLFLVQCVTQAIGVGLASSASSDSGAAAAAGGIIALLGGLLVLVLALATIPFILAGTVRFVQTGNIAQSLRFADTFALFRNNMGLILSLFLVQLLGSVIGGLGIIACFIGIIFTLPFGQAVFAHGLGQAAARLGGSAVPFGQQTPPSYTAPPTFQ